MKSVFNIETQTTPIAEYEFSPQCQRQRDYAEATECERIMRWRDVRGNAKLLPQYVKNAIHEAGYMAVFLGGTTYSHSVIGLTKKPAEELIHYSIA